jgi:hypothetical protein
MLGDVRFGDFVKDGSSRPTLPVQVVCTGSGRNTYVDATCASDSLDSLSVGARQVSESGLVRRGQRANGQELDELQIMSKSSVIVSGKFLEGPESVGTTSRVPLIMAQQGPCGDRGLHAVRDGIMSFLFFFDSDYE